MKIQTPINKRITRGASGVVGCPHHHLSKASGEKEIDPSSISLVV